VQLGLHLPVHSDPVHCRFCRSAGLDNAGKSTLLHKLCSNEVRAFVPTTKAHAKTFSLGSITFTAWDLGGHEQVRSRHPTRLCLPQASLLTPWCGAPGGPRCGIYGRSTTRAPMPLFSWWIAVTTSALTRCVCGRASVGPRTRGRPTDLASRTSSKCGRYSCWTVCRRKRKYSSCLQQRT
jgi:hypothetical protein